MESTCPVSPLCKWSGNVTDLLEHYQNDHSELIVPYPYTILPNIKKDNQSNQIFVVNGLTFLLHIKCSVIQTRIWHCVKLLSDTKMAGGLQFVVEYRNEEYSITKRKSVQDQNRMLTIYKEDCIEVHTSSLFRELGDYDIIKFSITIEFKTNVVDEPVERIKCSICQKITTKNDNSLCLNCSSNTCCKFKNNGCSYYFDNNFELTKHEEWYCEYSSKVCENCNKNLLKESLINHHKKCYKNPKHFLVDSNKMFHPVLKVDGFYTAVLKSYRTTFTCEWRVGKFGNIFMNIVADQSHSPFCCVLKFRTIYDSEITIKLGNIEDNQWSTNRPASETNLEDVILKNSYNMSLVITKHKSKIL